jgi:hypothetical protein
VRKGRFAVFCGQFYSVGWRVTCSARLSFRLRSIVGIFTVLSGLFVDSTKTIFTVFNNHFLTVLSCHFYTLKNGLIIYLTVATLTVTICHFYSAKWSFCTCLSGHFVTLPVVVFAMPSSNFYRADLSF